MCGAVKIRTVFVDADAVPNLPQTSCVFTVSPLLRELFVAAMRVPLDYAPATSDERLMRVLLDQLREIDVLPLDLPMPRDERLARICAALVARPDDASTAEQWARRLKLTSKTIHRLFARETGMTFGEWRQQARLLFALERLARGARVVDVALDAGYASQSAFTAMFRKHFGVPPNAFYR